MSAEKKVVRLWRGNRVLQRRAAPVVGMLAVVSIVSMGVIIFPVAIDRNSGFEMLFLGSFLVAAMRGIWRVLVRPRVIIYDDYLMIVDVLWRWRIPFKAIRRLGSDNGLRVFLIDNREVPVFAFSASLVDRGRTCEAAAREIRKAMNQKRGALDGVQGVRRVVDWTWMDFALIPFFILLVWGFIFEG